MKHRNSPVILRNGMLAALLASALALSACGDSTKRALGLSRTPPDEFQVVTRAPLTQPPDYKLRPPRPGTTGPAAVSTREQARQAVFRAEDASSGPAGRLGGGVNAPEAAPREAVASLSEGETAFLARAQALETDPLIRVQIDRETASLTVENENFVRKLLGMEQEPVGEIVDAGAEARRLRESRALGQPATGAEVPVIEREGGGILDIF